MGQRRPCTGVEIKEDITSGRKGHRIETRKRVHVDLQMLDTA